MSNLILFKIYGLMEYMKTKTKKLKLYGKKDEFEGTIAEIYIENNKVIVESKDKAVKEILEKEINNAIEDKGGLFVPFAETITNVLINGVKIQFYEFYEQADSVFHFKTKRIPRRRYQRQAHTRSFKPC